jgi:hypothetical protein
VEDRDVLSPFPSRGALRRVASVVALATFVGIAPVHAAPPSDTGSAEITFTGFDEAPDGTSHLYVKLTRPVSVEPSLSGTHVEYRLVGTTIPLRNNKNPLITSHFGTQIVSAQLVLEGAPKQKGKRRGKAKAKASPPPPPGDGARLVVQTREPVKPHHRVVQNADGSATLVIDFPKPSKPPPPEPDVIAPPPRAMASQAVPAE